MFADLQLCDRIRYIAGIDRSALQNSCVTVENFRETSRKAVREKDGYARSDREGVDSTGCRHLTIPGGGDMEAMSLQLMKVLKSHYQDRGW